MFGKRYLLIMAKGSTNERSKCKDWSLWWSQDFDPPRDDIFYRTHGSGGRARVRSKMGKTTPGSYGDMMMTDSIGEPLIKACTFEFKKGYNDLSLLLCIDGKGKKQKFKGFLDQVCNDANDAGNEPVLIIHRDYRKPVICIRKTFFNDIEFEHGYMVIDYIRIRLQGWEEFILFAQEVFFEWVSPQYFIRKEERG